MGVNNSRALSSVTNSMYNSVNQSGNVTTTCTAGITTGDITTKGSGCTVINENQCVSTAAAAMESMAEGAATAFQEAQQNLKTKLIPGFNNSYTKQDITQEIFNRMEQNCSGSASSINNIATGNIVMDCDGPSTIRNANMGTAQANCGQKTIIHDILGAIQEVKQESETGGLPSLCSLIGFDCTAFTNDILYGTLGISSISSCCCLVIIVIILLVMFIPR